MRPTRNSEITELKTSLSLWFVSAISLKSSAVKPADLAESMVLAMSVGLSPFKMSEFFSSFWRFLMILRCLLTALVEVVLTVLLSMML